MSFLCWGILSWMQDSRWGLTRAEQRARITSLNLLATLLLMQPRIQLAFWAMGTHCSLRSSFSSTSTPKSFSAGLLSSPSCPSLYWYWRLPRPRCRTWGECLFHQVGFLITNSEAKDQNPKNVNTILVKASPLGCIVLLACGFWDSSQSLRPMESGFKGLLSPYALLAIEWMKWATWSKGLTAVEVMCFFFNNSTLFNLSDWWKCGIDGTAAEGQHPQALN